MGLVESFFSGSGNGLFGPVYHHPRLLWSSKNGHFILSRFAA